DENQRLLIPIFKAASKNDLIKIGIMNLEEKQYKSGQLKIFNKKFKFNLDVTPFEHDDIVKIINRLSNINNLEDGIVILKELYQVENMLSYDFVDSMKSFIRKVNEKMPLCANKHSKNKEYSIGNKVEKAFVPDVKVEYTIRDVEILALELKKEENLREYTYDKSKTIGMLSDMLREIYLKLPHGNKNFISKIRAFAIIVSGMKIEIFQMNIPEKQLYVFQQISEFELPQTFHNYKLVKIPLPVLIDVDGDDELPTYQQIVPNYRDPNFYLTNNLSASSNNNRKKASNHRACNSLELGDSNNTQLLSFNPNVQNNFRILSKYVKYGSISVSQSDSTTETNALVRVQYNSLANDRIYIEQGISKRSFYLKIDQAPSTVLFGVSMPPKCIVANIELILPLNVDLTTNATTINIGDFDTTFVENPIKYNQTIIIHNDDATLQFNSLLAKSLMIFNDNGNIGGTIKGIEDQVYINADNADLNLNVGIADNVTSPIVRIKNDRGQIDGFTGSYDISTRNGVITTNSAQSATKHLVDVTNTSNNRFTNGSLTIKNISGKVSVLF
ncbi:11828_t:CDS:2, partial [Entrophospora sp. SA101]